MYTYANVIIHTYIHTYIYIYIYIYIYMYTLQMCSAYMFDTCEMYRQVLEQTGPAAKHGRWQMVDSAMKHSMKYKKKVEMADGCGFGKT